MDTKTQTTQDNYFITLNSLNVNDHVELKNNLRYISWPWAWAEAKKLDPTANYIIYERQTEFGPVNYFTDGRTCWVKTGLIINGIEHIEELPIMNYKNQALALEIVTSCDVNKTIQRSLTKAAARHGIGLYVFAGEDLPEEVENPSKPASTSVKAKPVAAAPADDKIPLETLVSELAGIVKTLRSEGKTSVYQDVVNTITKGTGFQVSKATDKDYDTVLAIHTELKKVLG